MYKLTTTLCLLVVMAIGFTEEAPLNRNWARTKKPRKIRVPLMYGYTTVVPIVKRGSSKPDESSALFPDDWRPNPPHALWTQIMDYSPFRLLSRWVHSRPVGKK